MRASIESIDHPALAGAHRVDSHSAGSGEADLVARVRTDRERIGVLMQVAALLSHLERADWDLRSEDWSRAWLDDRRVLRGLAAQPGAVTERARSPASQDRLRALLRLLFRTKGGVAGRGDGRLAARRLLARWGQDLRPISADEAIGQILTTASFLWDGAFELQRSALVAHVRSIDGRAERWIAGPGWVRRRFDSARITTLGEPGESVVRERSRTWNGTGVPSGGWARAARRSICAPLDGEAERLEAARLLIAVGRARSAQQAIAPVATASAEADRIVCAYYLGELGAAARRLRILDPLELSPGRRVEVGDIALRVFANRGRPEHGENWLRTALGEAGAEYPPFPSAVVGDEESIRLARDLLWAASAWDRRRLDDAAKQLESVAAARRLPALAWRWHQLRGLVEMERGELGSARISLERALAGSRRLLRPIDAAALWNDLVLCRAGVGDLPGAERACHHGLRLLRDAEGARLSTLFLSNLAEIQLRRGRVEGVEEIVRRATRANRDAGNHRGGAHDACLWARLELQRGQPETALARLRPEGRDPSPWNRSEARVLAARALGWLRRPAEARAELADVEVSNELEPEEVPALFAHAGDRGAALSSVRGPTARLWRSLLEEREILASDWRALDDLSAHRAARLVFDLERLRSGSVPGSWLLRAAESLRAAGARAFARELEAAAGGPWRAMAEYLEASGRLAGEMAWDALATLCRDVGCGDVRIVWRTAADEEVVVAGYGGSEVRTVRTSDGEIRLSAERLGSREQVLIELARRCALAAVEPVRRTLVQPMPIMEGSSSASPIVGESPGIRHAIVRTDRLAPTDLPVLIQGQTGTGKELFAQRLHEKSPRRGEPFLPVNCAALSETLLLSELFGHARGSFTGADRDRQGVFEAARGGTVFLDEIGDLPSEAQGALLRVLQEREVRRVGENRGRRVEARVVAATHRNLEARAGRGAFRSDLYFRLRAGTVHLPPLRERGSDIIVLAERFVAARGFDLSRTARARLAAYPWPGNVRELKNVLEAAMALVEPGESSISSESLDLPSVKTEVVVSSYHQQVDAFRTRLIHDAVSRCDGNRSRAAAELGLSRQAMSYLVRSLEIPV